MVGMAFAAVPLYSWFCRTTGFGGTPQVAAAAPGPVFERTVTVHFDANVSGGLPWRVGPGEGAIPARIGGGGPLHCGLPHPAAREALGPAALHGRPPR